MKAAYYQFVNFIQTMEPLWFLTIWLILFMLTLSTVIKFFKLYNGTQNSFTKVSLIVMAVIFFSLLVYLTYIRN